RSLIALFVGLSTTTLLVAKVVQRRGVLRRRGEALALLVGGASAAEAAEVEHLRGRPVERFAGTDPAALAARFRVGPVHEVVLGRRLAPDEVRDLVAACAEAGLPA